ncbi:7-cyano-7-deazaguanine synthase [Nocardiopsis flavescens]|uniref:7-cyano-7-deazaguanine synthase n=1 Tax=Nocardiopsis flavescens TaxID=758803 RepID=UPI0036685B1F
MKVELSEGNEASAISISTPLTKVLLSLIEATYVEMERIRVPNPAPELKPEEVGDFLSFILAFPPDVKTPIVEVDSGVTLLSSPQRLPVTDTIVLFSGGTDSSAAMLDLLERGEHFRALWCDYGQEYHEAEGQAVRRICKKLSIPLLEARIDLGEMIKAGRSRFSHIVPARNLLISAIAASQRPRAIVLSGLGDELMVPDKSPRMYGEAEKYLGYPIYSPFTKMNKTEIMCVWRKRWLGQLQIDETVSCFSTSGNCQNCSACAKREVSRIASGYSTKFPLVFAQQHHLIEHHWFPRLEIFPAIRRAEILIALSPFVSQLATPLDELVASSCQRFERDVAYFRDHFEKLSCLVDY